MPCRTRTRPPPSPSGPCPWPRSRSPPPALPRGATGALRATRGKLPECCCALLRCLPCACAREHCSSWPQAAPTLPTPLFLATPCRNSIADLPASSTFRVRSAFEAQLAARHGTAPSPPGGGADSSQGTPHVTVDDGLVGSARARRPGHRRLNRSRSANELDDILREAGLDQLGVPEPGAEWPSGDSPWRAATSSLVGPSGGGGAAAGAAAAADGATPTSRLQHVRTPSNLRAGSAPVLSSVLLGDFGLASSAAAAGPTLSSPHTAPRRPHLVAPPPGVAAAPMSPFSAGSELGESPSPQAAPREGGLPARWARAPVWEGVRHAAQAGRLGPSLSLLQTSPPPLLTPPTRPRLQPSAATSLRALTAMH